jgi:hypothetical protein
MMRPIRLHLDTSDYAIMYRAAPGTPEARVRDELIGLKESGRIEIGMSYHVVFELLQKAEPRFRDDLVLGQSCSHSFVGRTHSPIRAIWDRGTVSQRTVFGFRALTSTRLRLSALFRTQWRQSRTAPN